MNAAVRELVLTVLLLTLGPVALLPAAESFNSALLSEFMADNQRGLRDEDGDRAGWVEVHNAGSWTLNLSGWFLTDTPTNLTRWRFPRVALLPDKYLVVFASAKDRGTDPARLHANFRFDRQTAYLALVNPATNVVSELRPSRHAADVSYGRMRGEPAFCGEFSRPTPGKPNPINGPGFAPEVVFSRPGGTFIDPFPLALSCRATGAVVRYTVNGLLPNRSSPVYAAPLIISNTSCIRARAYAEGLLPGPPHSETYLLLHTNILSFTSTLPVLVMDTLGKDSATSARYSFVQLSLHEPVNGATSLTNRPTLTTRAGYRFRGSSSANQPQSAFALQLVDEFNDDQSQPLLGMPPDSDWVLYAPTSYEPVMIHNPFIHQLSRDLGRYSPRTRFVEVVLAESSGPVKAAHYYGVYVLEEKIKTGRHRVDIDRVGQEDLKPPEVTGGYLLKIDRLGPDEAGFYGGGVSMVYVEPKEQVITLPQRGAQRRYLTSFFDEFESALYGAKWKDPVAGYPAFLDVAAAIDYHVLETLSGNVDTLVLSTYLHKPRGGKIVFGPHWDFDRALGSTDGRDDDPRHWNTGRFFDAPWWDRLFDDPDFWQRWVDRWQELRSTHFAWPNLNRLIDQLADEVREAQPRQARRWGLHPRGGTYQSEIDLMKDWLSNRVDYIDGQLVPPPRLNHGGGRVAQGFLLSFSPTGSTNTTIHYTLDGSDPRLAQGGISSNAVVYRGPVPIGQDVRIMARARNLRQRQRGGPPSSTPWSGPVKADFIITPP